MRDIGPVLLRSFKGHLVFEVGWPNIPVLPCKLQGVLTKSSSL